ncbi:hypothetical protein [Flavobacterium sp. JAS]|uniref:hypothetical protein n=1 Tax=Flavobacterium sp. JAS TaxID=2897329 RepID=UPI001E63ABF3|nr:hypothetical protein [Flavobacterium sp. JAS]MCD0472511.1 hypothetical protein [Flavobacterium sp. JAS]
MEIRLASKEEFEVEVSEFRKIKIEKLRKIEPKWACGKHTDKIRDYSQHPEFGDYKIFNVSIEDLLVNVEFCDFDLTKLFVDDIASDYRVVSTLKRWLNNDYVDPLTLTLNGSTNKQFSISDGRHRFKISNFLGLKKIPIAIHELNIEYIGRIITLEEL